MPRFGAPTGFCRYLSVRRGRKIAGSAAAATSHHRAFPNCVRLAYLALRQNPYADTARSPRRCPTPPASPGATVTSEFHLAESSRGAAVVRNLVVAVWSDGAMSALDIVQAYYNAWTSKDIETAMSYVADDVICDAPAGRLEGIDAYRAFLGPFTGLVVGHELIGAFGDDDQAVLVYDIRTVPVASAPGAECVRVREGKIVYNRFIFDRLPFEQARRTAGT
jgi:ketosteroid isomerase-like protein